MKLTSTLLPALAASATANPAERRSSWRLSKFKSLVAFGDSYTDDSRLGYFGSHNGSAPPAGWVQPVNYAASTGGRTWPHYVAQYAGPKVYNYAVSGAACSNAITPRIWSTTGQNFPSVLEYEVPAFQADAAFRNASTGAAYFDPPLRADDTVYAIWIGTNDLGADEFVSDMQVPGKTIPDYVECVFRALDGVYKTGGRRFVVMNAAPLEKAPLYAVPPNNVDFVGYFPDKLQHFPNETELSYKMLEYTSTANAIYKFQTPYEVRLANRYPGAAFALYDVHSLFNDIIAHPAGYLNGTGTPDVTGEYCYLDAATWSCNYTDKADPDRFFWYDSLHPSEQVDRVLAKEFVNVAQGNSKYATYW